MNRPFRFLSLAFLATMLCSFTASGDNLFPGGCIGGKSYSERYSTFSTWNFTLKSATRNGKPIADTSLKIEIPGTYGVPIGRFDSLTTVNIFPDSSLKAISSFQLFDNAQRLVNIRLFKDSQ